jgi:hypothetical protein
MDPIVCFSPDLSSTVPSTSPTQAPTFMTTTVMQVTQTIEGVSVAAANSTAGIAVLQVLLQGSYLYLCMHVCISISMNI